jgi:hypothetical protein
MNRPQESNKDAPLHDAPLRAWVNPFNPCLPNDESETCERHPNLTELYAPFDATTPRFGVHEGLWRWWE